MWIPRLTLILTLAGTPALAHHSVAGNFDASTTIELEGAIKEVAWRNPHIIIKLAATDGSGQEWTVETHSLSIMRRMDAAEPFIKAGDHVKVSGWPARRGQGMFVNNMLLPSGEEFVFKFGAKPADLVWSDQMWGTNTRWFAESGNSSAEERGIFRVWSTSFARGLGDGFIWLREYPLTEEAQSRKAAFNLVTDDPLLNCATKGMPGLIGAPYPVEFQDRGDIIEFRLEEYDTVRTVYMNPETATEPTPSILGYSTGQWEGDTLVVETIQVTWGHLDGRGVMMSDQARLVERFTPVEEGGRLTYELTVTDPVMFTEPVVMTKSWVWLPDVKIEPYNCVAG
jgi:hypothetical protein